VVRVLKGGQFAAPELVSLYQIPLTMPYDNSLRVLFLAAGLMLFSAPLRGQGSEPSKGKEMNTIDWNGYVRSSFYGGGKAYAFTTCFAEAGFKMKYLKKNAFLLADLRFRSGYHFDEEFSELEARELFAGIEGKKADLYIGNQIIEWGRADGFNPTDNLTPVNYFFLSSDPEDQKMAGFLGRLKFRISPSAGLEAIVVPVFRPSVYRYDLFGMGNGITFDDPVYPRKTFNNGSYAVRLNVETGAADFSVSWFRGFDPFHGFGIRSVSLTTGDPLITYAPMSYRKNTFGFDYAIPLGNWMIRGEGCYNGVRKAGSKEFIPFSNVQLVTGVERNIAGFRTIIQYVGQLVPGFRELEVPALPDPTDPAAMMRYGNDLVWFRTASFNRRIFRQKEKSDHGMTFTVSRTFAYEAWKADLAAFYGFTSDEYYLRLCFGWNVSDALTVKAGAFVMDGPDRSVFDYAGRIMNGICLECKVNF
jgi:hypothetical protein